MTVTGTAGKEHVAVFDVCVYIYDRSVTAGACCALCWVHVTTRFVVMTALLGSVLPHLAVTCVGTESYSQDVRCITFSTYFYF